MNNIKADKSVRVVSYLTDAYKNVPLGVNQKLTMEFHPNNETSVYVIGIDVDDCRNGYKDWCSKNLQDGSSKKV